MKEKIKCYHFDDDDDYYYSVQLSIQNSERE